VLTYFAGLQTSAATRIYYVTVMSAAHDKALNGSPRLLSYYELRQRPDALADYVAGRLPLKSQSPKPWSRAYVEARKLALFRQIQEWERFGAEPDGLE
jgi:hypothetical protein